MVDYASAQAEDRAIREQKQHRWKYGAAVDEVIRRARASGKRETMEVDGAEVYAYPHLQEDRRIVAWGIMKGSNLIRNGLTSPGGGAEFVGCD
jgi:hypothetical protein